MKETNTGAVLNADIEGHSISTHALVIPEIGKDEDGKPIEILFGALAMQQWGIRPVPNEERLDLSHYPEEFVEFLNPPTKSQRRLAKVRISSSKPIKRFLQ